MKKSVFAVFLMGVLLLAVAAGMAGCGPADSASTNGTENGATTSDPQETTTPAGEEDADFSGLLIKAPEGFSITLCRSFGDSINSEKRIDPTNIVTADGWTKYYYAGIQGRYRYSVTRSGYYTQLQNVYVDPSQEKTVIEVSTDKRGGQGFEPISVKADTSAILENALQSDRSLWPDYQFVYNTPYFADPDRPEHQATTQQEMEAYLKQLDGQGDHMYVYSLGKSPKYGYDIPIVIFTQTDLSGAATLEEAAALIKANGKLTIHYQAQIHGNEPGGGEAALAMITRMQSSYGVDLLHHLNMYVIPRLNPDGSHDFTRNDAGNENLNRDMLTAKNVEVQVHHKALLLFEPEICIDSHEYTPKMSDVTITTQDMMISTGWSVHHSDRYVALSEEMCVAPFANLRANGLQPSYYNHISNRSLVTSGTAYMALRGSFTFLLESRGNGTGLQVFERRVTAHMVAMDSILHYVVENLDNVQQTVNQERQRIIDSGKTYEETDIFALKTKTAARLELSHDLDKWDTATGALTPGRRSVVSTNKIVRSRAKPTAYVIPAGETWSQKVLEIMEYHGISYDTLAPGSKVMLQSYSGTKTAASLNPEAMVTFENGAYVFTMDQIGALVISYLLEPDNNDIYSSADGSGTLVQLGIIHSSSNGFPVYRYIHDLNDRGEIDLA